MIGYEEQNRVSVENLAEAYQKKYPEHVNALESDSVISKVRDVTAYDVYALGQQLEAFEDYKQLCEDDGTLAQLGRIPNVAFDVITVNYGSSPLSVFASIQPISEERGTVYLKEVVAQTTRGNVTAGQTIARATAAADVSEPIGYAGDTLSSVNDTVAATLTYNITVPGAPLRTQKVTVVDDVNGLSATDNGDGLLLGYDMQGTVDYETGDVVVEYAGDPGTNTGNLVVTYATDFESAPDIPQNQLKFTSKSVNARVFALKSTVGIEQAYALRRRFSMVAEDEIATDLVSAINAEVCGTAISQLLGTAQGNTNWAKATPTGVSYFEHKQSFKDALSDAESVLIGNAGHGTLSTYVAGRDACALMQTLPGFSKISDGSTIGPHVFGTLDGTVIVRVPTTGVLPANKIIGIYKGASPFEAAMVYSPYMPLLVTTAMPTGANPLMNQKAAAVWAAIETLVPNFATTITIT